MNYLLMAEILERAKENLWDGIEICPRKDTCLCAAIDHTPSHNQAESLAKHSLGKWICDSIGRSMYVSSWLRLKGIDLQLDSYMAKDTDWPKMQAYRLAWINQMIGILRS